VFTSLRRITTVAVATIVVVGLTACSGTDAPPSGDPTAGTTSAAPAASDTAAPDTAGSDQDGDDDAVSFGRTPDSAGWPGCAQLLPSDLVDALVPGAAAEDPLTEQAHTLGAWAFPQAAEGTSCWATDGVSPIDDVAEARRDDPVFQGVHVSVLPDARPEFRATGGSDAASASMSVTEVRCDASDAARVQCQGGVLAGDAWVQITVIRLQDSTDATPEALLPAFRTLLEHAQQDVADSAGASVSSDHPAASSRLTVCDSSRVDEVSDVDLSTPSDVATDIAAELGDFAMHRVAAANCVFRYDGTGRYPLTGAAYSALPDGGWVLEQRLGNGTVDRSGRLDLDGLESGDAAWRTCDDMLCSVDVLRDGTWEHFALWRAVAPDTTSAIVRWVEASLAA